MLVSQNTSQTFRQNIRRSVIKFLNLQKCYEIYVVILPEITAPTCILAKSRITGVELYNNISSVELIRIHRYVKLTVDHALMGVFFSINLLVHTLEAYTFLNIFVKYPGFIENIFSAYNLRLTINICFSGYMTTLSTHNHHYHWVSYIETELFRRI